jgi:RHS repeat-associated protein
MSNKPLHEWQAVEVGPDANSVSEVLTWLFEEESFAPVAKLTAQDSYSVVSDHLGTPLALYNEKGMLAWTMALDTYGAVRQGKGRAQDCPFRYQGQYEDTETGLYYNRLRYYDPEVGCYISQDPIQLEGGLGLYSTKRETFQITERFRQERIGQLAIPIRGQIISFRVITLFKTSGLSVM